VLNQVVYSSVYCNDYPVLQIDWANDCQQWNMLRVDKMKKNNDDQYTPANASLNCITSCHKQVQ